MEAESPRAEISLIKELADKIKANIHRRLIGQERMIDLLMAALLSNGHVLIEGVPGIAKTLTARLLAKSINAGFSRIQFTPDLMPSDITGTSVFKINKGEFEFKKGPVFSNIVLIDEINRSPAKTQAALFEVMEERQITVDGITYPMSSPFLVVATQNPIEYEGTYRLPEAQCDRFIAKISPSYPTIEEEIEILSFHHKDFRSKADEGIDAVVSIDELLRAQRNCVKIHVEPQLFQYIAAIIQKTRVHNALYLGASPRASVSLLKMCKAWAALQGRDFVTPDDVKEMLVPVLSHRILLTPEKEMEGVVVGDVLKAISETIEVPR